MMNGFNHKTCLITGGEGFLAANLALALVEQGANVVATAQQRSGDTSLRALRAWGRLFRLEHGDIGDYGFVQRLVSAYEVDYVFHLAAVSAVRVARACPTRAFAVNVGGTLNVLEACRTSGRPVKGIVVASSDKAYGQATPPYWETLRLEPMGTYEASKAAMEMVCRAYRYEYGLPLAVTRCANLYGPGDLNWTRIVPGSIKRALAGEAPIVYQESAAAEREFMHVADACRAYLLLASEARELAHLEYNVGSGEVVSVWELAQRISRECGGPEPLVVPRPGSYVEIDRQEVVGGRLAELGWRPAVKLAAGLTTTVRWYRGLLGGSVLLPQLVMD